MTRALALACCVALMLPPGSALADAPEPSAGSAESSSGPAVGARVRVTAPAVAWDLYRRRGRGQFVGTVLSVDDRSLTIAAEGRKEPLVVSLSSVQRLEISRRRSRKGKGFLTGFLAGTGIGVLLVAMNHGTAACDSTSMSPCDLALSAVLVGFPGAILGSITSPGERWEEIGVDEAPVRVGFGPAPGGGVGFSARWSFGSSRRAPRLAPSRTEASSAMGPPAPACRR